MRHPVLGDDLVCVRLSCGLELYAYLKPTLERRHALLTVDYGSADAWWWPERGEEARPAPHGVAHFLEHRLFDKADGDITARFTAVGADVDAHTTFTSTGYSFTSCDHFDEGLALLLELVLTPHFSEAAVRRERDIITREIELSEDSVDWVAFSAVLRSLYGRGAMGDDIAGTPESLAQIDLPLLESCYRSYYRPERMALVVAGDIDVSGVVAAAQRAVEQALGSAEPGQSPAWSRSPVTASPRREMRRLATALPRLLVAGVSGPTGLQGLDLLRHELCLDLALDILLGPSSGFYTHHYQAGLVDDDTFGYEIYCEPAFTFCVIGGDTPEPDRLEEEVAAQVDRGLCGGIIGEGFERSLRRSWGHLLCRYEEVEGCAAMVHSAAARGASAFDYFAAYKGLEAADVAAALDSCMGSRPWGVATVLPHEGAAPGGESA